MFSKSGPYSGGVAEGSTEGIQDLRMNINMQNGNVNNRFDALKGITESFTYDDNERLLSANVDQSDYSITMNYSDFGNLEHKSDVGDYTYHDHKIFAVKQVSNPNNVVPNQAQNVTYNSFAQPANIVENNHRLILQYGADGNRNKTTLKDISNNQDIYTRYYFGDVEMQVLHEDNDLKQTIHYISGLHGLAAMAVKEDNGNFDFYYTYTDHLGSILTVTDNQANIIADQNFDAWGRRRNVNDWSFTPPLGESEGASWLYRGYTGHEHLPEFNLINMNGRLYDPLLARFLSPDNFVQSPFNTQSHNRFSYVFNNPLKYNDPSGEIAHILVPIGMAIAGAYLGGAAVNGNFNPGKWD